MQCSPHELKEKLLKGLDEENNVVDMATVVAVISILEKYPMSREALEQTRIGRYVNELRKKTKNEQLAKRAKKLVKNWQHLINSDNPIVNGDNGERLVHPNVANLQSPSLGSLSPAYVKSSQVKRLPGSKPTTPSLPSSKPNTPTLQQKVKPNTPAIKSKPNTPSMPQYFKQTLSPSLRSTPTSSPRLHSTPKFAISPNMTFSNDSRSPAVSPVSSCSRPSTPVDTPLRPPSSTRTENLCRLTRNMSQESLSSACSEKLPHRSKHSPELNGKAKNRNIEEKLSKTNIANRKRARKEYSDESQNKTAKIDNCVDYSKMNGAVKSSSNSNTQKTNGSLSRSPSEASLNKSFPSRKNVSLSVNTDFSMDKSNKTPKVKTTAQIIAELQARSGSASVGSDIIKQIETNQIVKESDVPESALPPGARPKRNKKRMLEPSLLDISTPSRSHANLSQTKSDLVQKFLQTSVTPSSAVDMTPFRCDDHSESLESGKGESSVDVIDSSGGDIVYRSDEVRSHEQTDQDSKGIKLPSLEEIQSNLPPIDYDNVLHEDSDYDIPDRGIVSEDIIDKLHNEQWTSVNGNLDSNGEWYDWTQLFTNLSYSDEPLHILPYVLLDD